MLFNHCPKVSVNKIHKLLLQNFCWNGLYLEEGFQCYSKVAPLLRRQYGKLKAFWSKLLPSHFPPFGVKIAFPNKVDVAEHFEEKYNPIINKIYQIE